MPLSVTTDIEWCSEEDIASLFALAEAYSVPLFPFLTHDSGYLRKRGGPQGIHPNFLPGSTHGTTEQEVIDHCLGLVPKATAFRAHCFYSHSRLLWNLADHGITVDCNLLTYLDYRSPFRNVAGMMTYPTYWSDDVAMRKNEWSLEPTLFQRPEVLVCNVHPKNHGELMVNQLFALAKGNAVPFESLP